jgi:hypothetical protein
MFTAVLFVISPNWNLTKCPLNGRVAKQSLVYPYHGLLLRSKKKNMQQFGWIAKEL